MQQRFVYRNCDPAEKKQLTALIEQLVLSIQKQLPHFPADTVLFRGMLTKHPSRKLYRFTATLSLPRRLLSAQEEGHNAEEVLRLAFMEIERQLQKYKELLRNEPLWRRVAKRKQIRQQVKLENIAEEERDRELYLLLIQQHLKKLYNFVRRELAYFQATGDLLPGELTPQEIVDAVVLRGYREFTQRPPTLEVDRWLLKLVLEELSSEIKRLKAERDKIMYLEETIPEEVFEEGGVPLDDEIYEFYQPDEKLHLEDILPDPNIPTPEQVAESRDLQRYINQTLAQLPRVWRTIFVLHYGEELSIPEVASVTGLHEDEVQRNLEYAREFLRQKLLESEQIVSDDEAMYRFFGSTADIEIPESLQNRIADYIRQYS